MHAWWSSILWIHFAVTDYIELKDLSALFKFNNDVSLSQCFVCSTLVNFHSHMILLVHTCLYMHVSCANES